MFFFMIFLRRNDQILLGDCGVRPWLCKRLRHTNSCSDSAMRFTTQFDPRTPMMQLTALSRLRKWKESGKRCTAGRSSHLGDGVGSRWPRWPRRSLVFPGSDPGRPRWHWSPSHRLPVIPIDVAVMINQMQYEAVIFPWTRESFQSSFDFLWTIANKTMMYHLYK